MAREGSTQAGECARGREVLADTCLSGVKKTNAVK